MEGGHKDFSKIPLSEEEWAEVREYQKVPAAKKLEMLDRMRFFMFEVWRQNPEIRQTFEEMRKGGW